MTNYIYWAEDSSEAIEHYGTSGMKWRQRRYQYEDGSLTPEGRKRYLKGDGSLTRAGKRELDRRNRVLDYERGRRVLEAENAAKRGDDDTVNSIKGLLPATSLDDTTFKRFEEQYDRAVGQYGLNAYAYGAIGGIKSELFAVKLANDRFTKAVGKYADPDDAIQDYIGWKGYSATVKEDKLAPFKQGLKDALGLSSRSSSAYNIVTSDKDGKTVRTPLEVNSAEAAVDAYIKMLNKEAGNSNKSVSSK